MANWLKTLDLGDVMEVDEDDSSSLSDFCKVVSERLKPLTHPLWPDWVAEWKDSLVEDFFELHASEVDDVHDVDEQLRDLYEWGDISLDGKVGGKKVCFIETMDRNDPSH